MASILKVDTIQTTAGVTYVNDGSILSAETSQNSSITSDANNATRYLLFSDGTSGSRSIRSHSNLTYNPGTNTLSATNFSGSFGGNATTATRLQTSRTINGVSFNGSANIVTNPSSGAYSNGYGARTVSTSNPSGGSDGDIWYKY